MSKKQKTYTAEFKVEAIKLIEANQGNVSETARQLGISMQTLSNWNNKAKTGTLAGTKQYSPDLNVMCAEKTGGFNLVNYRHSSGVYHEQETEDLHRRI